MSVYRTAMWMTMAIIVSKLFGFVREILFANFFGATYVSDAYFMAISIPSIIVGGIFTTIATSYIPIYSGVYEKEGEERACAFTNNLINIVLLVTILVSFISIGFAKEIVNIFAHGFRGEQLELTVYFVKVTFLSISLVSILNILNSFLQYHNKFVLLTIVGFSFNFVIFIVIIISAFYIKLFLVWGLLIAYAVQFIFTAAVAYKNKYKYSFLFNLRDDNIKKLFVVTIPIFIASFAGQINSFVDKMLASSLPVGSIAALNYGNQISMVVYGLLTMAMTTIIYPLFSKQAAADNIEGMEISVIKSLKIAIIFLVPVSVGLMILREPIIHIVYERGAFDEKAAHMTAVALFFFSIGIVGIGLRDILGKAFFSIYDTKTPMVNGIICMVINVILNLMLINKMGIAGLALSTSIAAITSAILLCYSFYKKNKSKVYRKIILLFFKTLLAAAIMGIVVYYANILSASFFNNIFFDLIRLVAITLAGAVIYYITLILQKVEETHIIKKIFKEI